MKKKPKPKDKQKEKIPADVKKSLSQLETFKKWLESKNKLKK